MTLAYDATPSPEDLLLRAGDAPAWCRALARLAFRAERRAAFFDQLSMMLGSGAQLPTALAELWQVHARCVGNVYSAALDAPLVIAIPEWLDATLGHGTDWPEAARQWFSSTEADILAAFYRSQLNAESLDRLSAMTRRQSKWTRKAISGAFPLLFALALIVIMAYAAGIYFFPELLKNIRAERLSGHALAAKRLSDFFLAYGWIVIGALPIVPVAVAWSLPRMTGRARVFLDHTLPPWTVYRSWTGAAWLLSLSALLRAGQDVHTALEHMLERASPYLAERLRFLTQQDDKHIGEALASSGYQWPDPMTITHLTIAMRTAKPADALEQMALRWMDNMTEQMDRSAEYLAMLGTVAIALFAAWMVFVSNDITQAAAKSLIR